MIMTRQARGWGLRVALLALRDERGHPAPAGLYFVRLCAGHETLTERFVQLP